MKKEDLEFFKTYKEICAAYQLADSTINFDVATEAPKAGIPYRNKMMSILAGEAFSYRMNPENLRRLETMYEEAADADEIKQELGLYFKLIEEERRLPKDLYVRRRQVLADSQNVWEQAKAQNDFAMFLPYLESVVSVQREMLTYMDKTGTDYDYMLSRFQTGTNMETYDSFFAKIKENLLPLIHAIQKEGRVIDDSPLFGDYDIKEQKAFLEELEDYMQVDRSKCLLTTSAHPFTDFFSANEARITTRFHKNSLMPAIFSTIHEYGHAQYALQVKEEYDGTAFKDAIGYAMHESQSRLMENHIGRNFAFWEANYPKLQTHFHAQLGHITLDNFVKMINVSRPSLIRIEADELTYPIHILIRYELEKEIFNGNVALDQLETMWNDKYEAYLGVSPTCAAEGILQDVHWSAGNLGYFPTYALGSAYAAQIFHSMQKELDVDAALRGGDFQTVSGWLKEHVHQYGASRTVNEILIRTTGEPFNPDYYIDYLIGKYTKLYEL